MAEQPDPKNPKVRGAAIAAPLAWIQETYGQEILQSALAKLPPEEQPPFRRNIIVIGWYSVLPWDRLVTLCQKEIEEKTGETAASFRSRLMKEGGGRILQSLYRFIFSIFQTHTVLARLFAVHSRLYDQGKSELLVNEPLHCVARFSGPVALYQHTRTFTRYGLIAAVELAGGRAVEATFTRDEIIGEEFVIEANASYQV